MPESTSISVPKSRPWVIDLEVHAVMLVDGGDLQSVGAEQHGIAGTRSVC